VAASYSVSSLPDSRRNSSLTTVQTTKADKGQEVDATTQIAVLTPIEITRIAVISARAMRILAACNTPETLLPAIRTLFVEIGDWYDSLPLLAGATELSHTPWDEPRVCLAYIHLGHLGAISLIFRRTLSVYKLKSAGQKHALHPTERIQLATIFSDGILAAEQASRIMYLFLGEQAGIRHCWAIMYISPSSHISYHAANLTTAQLPLLHLRRNPPLLH
jgi:hypothetical protein